MTTQPRQNIMHLLQGNKHDERRQHGRIRCTALFTRFGKILDMSASGMRVHCKGWRTPELNDVMEVEIKHPHGVIMVTSKIVWRERLGLRQYMTAFRFMDLTPEKQRQIVEVAQESLQAAALEETAQSSTHS